MSWSIIRNATRHDYDLLDIRAESFIHRHSLNIIDVENPNHVYALESCLDQKIQQGNQIEAQEAKYHLGLWKQIVKNALRSRRAEGIAWGTVGFTVE